MNNFANVEHFADRNVIGVAYMNEKLALNDTVFGTVAISSLKAIARKAFGFIPLFRPVVTPNGVETFQIWYNEFAEANNIRKTIHVTGVWNEETQAAFDNIVAKA